MPKGYWIIRIDVTQPDAFMAYANNTGPVLQKYGAKFLVRAGKFRSVEGDNRTRNTLIEFPSYQAALDCWESEEYQALKKIREGACLFDLVVIEGISE